MSGAIELAGVQFFGPVRGDVCILHSNYSFHFHKIVEPVPSKARSLLLPQVITNITNPTYRYYIYNASPEQSQLI